MLEEARADHKENDAEYMKPNAKASCMRGHCCPQTIPGRPADVVQNTSASTMIDTAWCRRYILFHVTLLWPAALDLEAKPEKEAKRLFLKVSRRLTLEANASREGDCVFRHI